MVKHEKAGCNGCIHYGYRYWELTNDSENICNHEPHPENIDAVFDDREPCKYHTSSKTDVRG